MIEISAAIKVPTVDWQIIGIKQFQMELGKPEVQKLVNAEKYLAKEVLEYLCNLEDQENPITQECINKVKEQPDYFVLKSINEGGGGNYFGTEIIEKIKDLKEQNLLSSHMLVRRFYPTPHSVPILSKEKLIKEMSVIDQIGIYHGYVAVRDEKGTEHTCIDEVVGNLIRSKQASKNETAISFGGAIGSIYLTS